MRERKSLPLAVTQELNRVRAQAVKKAETKSRDQKIEMLRRESPHHEPGAQKRPAAGGVGAGGPIGDGGNVMDQDTASGVTIAAALEELREALMEARRDDPTFLVKGITVEFAVERREAIESSGGIKSVVTWMLKSSESEAQSHKICLNLELSDRAKEDIPGVGQK